MNRREGKSSLGNFFPIFFFSLHSLSKKFSATRKNKGAFFVLMGCGEQEQNERERVINIRKEANKTGRVIKRRKKASK